MSIVCVVLFALTSLCLTYYAVVRFRVFRNIKDDLLVLLILGSYLGLLLSIYFTYFNDLLEDLLVNLIASIIFLLITLFVVDTLINQRNAKMWENTARAIRYDITILTNKLIGLTTEGLGRSIMSYNPKDIKQALGLLDTILQETENDLHASLLKLNETQWLKLDTQMKDLKKDVLEILIIAGSRLEPLFKENLILIKQDLDSFIQNGSVFDYIRSTTEDESTKAKSLANFRVVFLPQYEIIFKSFFAHAATLRKILASTESGVV